MAEFRQNPATREWILFAPERRARPKPVESLSRPPVAEYEPACPFCPGREAECTPGETLRYNDKQGNWLVRSYPNRYPAVGPGQPVRSGDSLARHMPAAGHHEVVCEAREHDLTLARMRPAQAELVVRAWHERSCALRADPRTDHVSLFKNHGRPAGTSLEHPHSQIVTLPLVPWQVRHRLEEAARYYDDSGHCVVCDILQAERKGRVRLVVEGPCHTAFIPYASYRPYTVWVVPHRHSGCLSLSDPGDLPHLARILHEVLVRLDRALNDPPFNLVFRVGSRGHLKAEYCHWYIAVVPRLHHLSGFELGTGMYINTSLPEEDAQALGAVDVS